MTSRVHDFATRREGATGRMRALARLEAEGRRVRRKPRTEERQRMLVMMAQAAVRERVSSGRIERIAPREYILHPRVTVRPREMWSRNGASHES